MYYDSYSVLCNSFNQPYTYRQDEVPVSSDCVWKSTVINNANMHKVLLYR